MLIPPSNTILCPARILSKRSFSSDVGSTAQSFKSWDSCMDNKTCKIIAIVGIVLAVLVAMWIISSFIRCCCMGAAFLESLCCCCCRAPRQRQVQPDPYANPNMYASPQPIQTQPPPVYFSNQGYQSVPPANNVSYGYVSDKSVSESSYINKKEAYDDEHEHNPFSDSHGNAYEMSPMANHNNARDEPGSYRGYSYHQ